MVLSEGEAQRLMEILADRAGIVQDTWHKVGPPHVWCRCGCGQLARGHPHTPPGPWAPASLGHAAQKVLETPPPASSLLLPGMAG